MEYVSKEGLKAVNGIYAVFNVEPFMTVSVATKPSKDRKQRDAKQEGRKKSGLFADVLDVAISQETEAPAQYNTVVYGRNGLKSTMQYQTREYR